MEFITNPELLIALFTLIFMEIVLGVDNIIFISIVSNRLPEEEQKKARFIGISLALIIRLILLAGVSFLAQVTEPLFTVLDFEVSTRDLILFGGGLFLIAKSTMEIHHKMENLGEDPSKISRSGLGNAIFQIIILDIIFSVDSILTAVGLTDNLILMYIAVIVSMIIMLVSATKIADFIKQHPSLEVLALSFLILIGFMLVVEAAHSHVPKGYIYFAVFFSLFVEIINIRIHRKKRIVRLNKRYEDEMPEKSEVTEYAN